MQLEYFFLFIPIRSHGQEIHHTPTQQHFIINYLNGFSGLRFFAYLTFLLLYFTIAFLRNDFFNFLPLTYYKLVVAPRTGKIEQSIVRNRVTKLLNAIKDRIF